MEHKAFLIAHHAHLIQQFLIPWLSKVFGRGRLIQRTSHVTHLETPFEAHRVESVASLHSDRICIVALSAHGKCHPALLVTVMRWFQGALHLQFVLAIRHLRLEVL